MTNWGIPNWLDLDSYGDTSPWSWNRWRWEFTRRREDARADFLAHKDETVRIHQEVMRLMEGRGGLRPDQPGFAASVPDCHKKYGISQLPNPAIGDQPFYVIVFHKRRPAKVTLPKPAEVTYPEGPATEDEIDRRGLEETDVVIKFDVTAPLNDQWKRVRPLLVAEQERRVGHIVSRGKKHPTKWLTYLRVLDARESGASYAEIVQSGILNGRSDAQAARDVFEQARALCFKWPV